MYIKIFEISPALLELANPLTYSHYVLEVLFGLLLVFEDQVSAKSLGCRIDETCLNSKSLVHVTIS